jgi:hypothetical protein
MYLLKLQLNNPQIILKMFTAVRVGVDEPEIISNQKHQENNLTPSHRGYQNHHGFGSTWKRDLK